jgi:DNA replication protein DnaC
MSQQLVQLQDATIRQHCKTLRLPSIGAQFSTLAEQAVREKKTHLGYMEALLSAESEERERNTIGRRIKEAHLPRVKTLEEFDYNQTPMIREAGGNTAAALNASGCSVLRSLRTRERYETSCTYE